MALTILSARAFYMMSISGNVIYGYEGGGLVLIAMIVYVMVRNLK